VKYADYVRDNLDLHARYGVRFFVLDDIYPDFPADGAENSYCDWLYMCERGFGDVVIPIHPGGEDLRYLELYLDAGCDYIALSGVKNSIPRTNEYLAECFEIIGDQDVRVHALGIGTRRQLRRYPFYTADAATMVMAGQKYGRTTVDDVVHLIRDKKDIEAARRYKEARWFCKLDRELVETRPFNFHNVFTTVTLSHFVLLWLLGHRKALVPYFYTSTDQKMETVRQMIEQPPAV
jgi:hypothetical protein